MIFNERDDQIDIDPNYQDIKFFHFYGENNLENYNSL